ncbi:hypothetical protein L917_17709 [Phytophthora nicotianae]|uniref:Uncharacterized protein n=1 Tax=Phytophthora nicotianae TaxID=4792 RepID=W2FXA1_PHYNI|nr:hypothetical protein L915_17986 [Phytophthora nicotianae]ETL82063.1 hypothetical protein L917_17709 [Phytophthora nicotianae]
MYDSGPRYQNSIAYHCRTPFDSFVEKRAVTHAPTKTSTSSDRFCITT